MEGLSIIFSSPYTNGTASHMSSLVPLQKSMYCSSLIYLPTLPITQMEGMLAQFPSHYTNRSASSRISSQSPSGNQSSLSYLLSFPSHQWKGCLLSRCSSGFHVPLALGKKGAGLHYVKLKNLCLPDLTEVPHPGSGWAGGRGIASSLTSVSWDQQQLQAFTSTSFTLSPPLLPGSPSFLPCLPLCLFLSLHLSLSLIPAALASHPHILQLFFLHSLMLDNKKKKKSIRKRDEKM